MGSLVSAVLAELVMQKVERVALETSLVPIRWWKRYVDDSNACLKSNDEICFVNHLNSINPNIQFTIETPSYDQEFQCMPFLDTEVCKLNNGEILTKVHWKSTHTDKYLTYDSHNPRQDKKAVVKSLINRAEIVPSTRELKKQEKEKILQDLSLNGYTKSFINNACKKTKKFQPSEPVQIRGRTCLPSVKGVSERLKHILENAGVQAALKPCQTLADVFRVSKERPTVNRVKGIVYKVNK